MRIAFASWCTVLLVFVIAATAAAATAARESAVTQRVEARSADLLAVALVRGDRMTIHLSRLIDNAPVRDAAVTVVLRGAAHPAIAQTDGSYALQTGDLTTPGAAAVEFQVVQPAGPENLKGTLQIASVAGRPENRNSARQLWWWVLNFAVCIGFLWLISRRRKDPKAG